jgi:predicted RNA methylase
MNYWEELNRTDHLSKEEAQEQGSFYTPRELAVKMAKLLDWKPGQKILDPCCGRGALFQACKEIYDVPNDLLYGVDIDPHAIEFCTTMFPGGRFMLGDCLEDDITFDHFWKPREYVTQSYEEFCLTNKPPFKFGVRR